MPLLALSSSATPLCFSQWKTYNSNSPTIFSSNSFTPFRNTTLPIRKTSLVASPFRHKFSSICNALDHDSDTFEYSATYSLNDVEDLDEKFIEKVQKKLKDAGSPWEGAVIYKRDASVLHLEYCTTLERLGLGKISTDDTKKKASVMGLRVAKSVKDYPNGTPVQISIDVTRKKKKLRLDGIIKTVITLPCNRCGKRFAEGLFTEFALLLTEDPPVEDPGINDLGFLYGVDQIKTLGKSAEDDEDALIEPDDQLHFPRGEQEIDISKNIRDRVFIEIFISVCDPGCKGICLTCGKDLNITTCSCSKEEVKEKSFGPLRNLREKIQAKQSKQS